MESLLTRLNAELHEMSRRPSTRRALIRWGARYPSLSGLADLAELLTRRQDPDLAPGVLSALAEMAPDDDLAARVLLHALMPGLAKIARVAGQGDPSAIEEVVALAWERVRTYPMQRNGSVAANVLLDVRKWYQKHRSIEAPWTPRLRPEVCSAMRSAEDEALARVTLSSLSMARRRGLISQAALDLIVRTRMVGIPIGEIAREQQVRVQVLAMRRLRAERKLLAQLPFAA